MTETKSSPAWLWLAFAVLGSLWLILLRHLSVHWSVNPQYSFGWLVPFLAAYLFQRRWADRPAAENTRGSGWVWIGAAAAFCFFPTWLIEQPNPDWRIVSWSLGLEITLLTLALIYGMGGSAWLSHFAFPTGFTLSAVPWPTGLELVIIPALTGFVAGSTVEILNLAGIPALQHGNVIEVATGVLGIDEACSGIRSFQATFMASLFLGELYRFTWQRRVFLLVAGSAIALGCNILRAFFLALQAAHHGIGAVAKYHDPAGFAILTVCFLLVWALAVQLSPARVPAPNSREAPRPLPIKLLSGLATWMVFSILGTEWWYRSHETAGKIRWDLRWPTERNSFHDLPIPEKATAALQYDEGRAAAWSDGNRSWTAFFFKWNAGPARSRLLARTHRPDICLPAGGFKLEQQMDTIAVIAAGLSIPFQVFEFSSEEQRFHVFFCVWQDSANPADANDGLVPWNRVTGVRSVLRGERNVGQQVLEIVIYGCATQMEAEAALRGELNNLIERNSRKTPAEQFPFTLLAPSHPASE